MLLRINSSLRLMCGIVGLLVVLSGADCSLFNQAHDFEANLEPSSREINAGGSVKIAVNAKRPPTGLIYRWRTPEGYGQCEPSRSTEPLTIYKAPTQLPSGRTADVNISVEFILKGEIIGQKVVTITVKPGGEGSTQTGTPSVTPTVESKPTIQITQIPPYNLGGPIEMFTIGGKVSGVSPSDYRVIFYAQTDYWYIQPYNTGPVRFTEIESDGSFSNQTHGGIRYAALLVRYSLTDPPIKTDRLPEIGKDVLAISVVQGIK